MTHSSIRLPALAVSILLLLAACGGTATASKIETVTAARADELIQDGPDGLIVLDVRTPEEFAEGHLAEALNIDFYDTDFRDQLAELDRERPYVMYCRSGNRSATAREVMEDLGFSEVYEIGGGILSWAEAGLPLQR